MLKKKSAATNLSFNPVLKNELFLEIFNSRIIKIVAPASGTSPEKIEQLQLLSELNIEISSTIINQDILFHASGDDQRFEQLKKALYDKSKKTIIWTLRGGYGSARLIDRLSKLPMPKDEKIFIGFSDNTALHLFLSQQWHWQTIHAAGFAQILDPTQDSQNYMKIAEIVANSVPTQSISNLKPLNIEATGTNEIKGYLTGGNLTIVGTSIGTPWQIQTAGKIVFLEETGEKGYRIDRSLNHLRQAGLLKDVKAVLFGAFMHKSRDNGINIALERFAKETSIPIYKTDQFGHGKINYPLIYNTMYEIIPTDNQYYDLRIDPGPTLRPLR
jgi:muramoyltetrapeptide carboxypeptidase